jgi:hypothetical protein
MRLKNHLHVIIISTFFLTLMLLLSSAFQETDLGSLESLFSGTKDLTMQFHVCVLKLGTAFPIVFCIIAGN